MNQGRAIYSTKERVTPLAVKEAVAKPVAAGTVLLSFKLSIGKVGIAQRRMFTNEAIAALPVRNGVPLEREYLAWALQHLDLAADSNRAAMGATLNKASLALVKLPLPPIDEQRRIAAILDHANTLRDAAARRRPLLQDLVAAQFRRYFGELGPDDDRARPLGAVVVAIENGRSPVCESRPRQEGEYGVLKLGAVTHGDYRPTQNKAYLGPVLSSDRAVRATDLLMTRKNTKDLVGAVAYVEDTPERLLLPDLIFRLNYDADAVHPVFLQRLLMTGRMRSAVRGLASGSAASMPNISKARLLELPVPIPSMAQQLSFVSAAAEVRKQNQPSLAEARHLNELVDALQALAFSGRL
jgi:type I restriction enzyme S subunit